MKRGFRKQEKGLVVIFGVIVFAAVILSLNWVLYDNMETTDVNKYTQDIKAEEGEKSFWEDPLGWMGQQIGNVLGGVLTVLTLDVPILNELGFVGGLIRLLYTIMVGIAALDLLWIG